ncbi:MAG: hypothetical protein JO074_08720, partial [Frankiales bacterium]|nr:hypothetical protein [Frankiales bacterium]
MTLPTTVVQHSPVVGPQGPATGAGHGAVVSYLLYAGVVTAGALIAPELLRRRLPGTLERAVGSVAALTAVIVVATRGEEAWTAALTAVHLTVVTVWVGAVVHLAAVTVRRRAGDWRSHARAFTPVAVASAALTSLTGILLALRDHIGWAALVSTMFGLLLLVKALALVFAALLGLGHRLARDDRDGTVLLRAEATVLAVALAFGSALVSTAVPAAAVTVSLPGVSTVAVPDSAPVSVFLLDDNHIGRLLLLSDQDVAVTDRSTGEVTQLAAGAVTAVMLRHGHAHLSIASGSGSRDVRLAATGVAVPRSTWLVTAAQRTQFALGRVLAHADRTSAICLPSSDAVATAMTRLLRGRTQNATVLDPPADLAVRRLHLMASSANPAAALILAPS